MFFHACSFIHEVNILEMNEFAYHCTKVWDADAKFCLKIDISEMKKYPDFGYLIDFNAYVDEDCLYWEDKAVQAMLRSKDQQ